MQRVLEVEVMDTAEEARDYDAMDHSDVNRQFCADFLAFASSNGRSPLGRDTPANVVDFGTGTALIPLELCKQASGIRVTALDLSAHMLAQAQVNITRAGLGERVTVQRVDAKGTPFANGTFHATMSNSIIHHIPTPSDGLAEMLRVTSKGGSLFVRDLCRPETEGEVARLVALYSGVAPSDPTRRASFEHQRELFRASLCAALTVPELVALVASLGIPSSACQMTSDRHWTLAYEKP